MTPKHHLLFIVFLVFSTACKQKSSDEHQHHDNHQSSANQELYDEVMSIHDEVMPKMNDIYKLKTAKQTRLEMPGLPEQERQQIQNDIARLDSASEGMMIWMREFDPIPDSAGEAKARAYLEAELEKVKKVRENILEALQSTQ
ncbi:MAG TPA: hypothetical protein VFT90_00350 [Chryseosolibacter sp.]|nr:hypothetical protein [Chryseosolibacter sp.]